MLHGIIHSYCIKKRTLESQKKLKKIDCNLKSYLENPTNFIASWFHRPISKLCVSTLLRKLMDFPTNVIFRVSLDLASIRPESPPSRSYSMQLKLEFPVVTDNFQRS
jgi:hypothetical protein